MKKQSLAARALAFLKGGDEAKMARFESKVGKYLSKQVSMRKEKIEQLEEKVVDAQEELEETVLNIDLSRINSTEGAESYVTTYIRDVRAKEEVVANLKKQIEDLQSEIEDLQKTEETIYSVEEKA